MNFILSMISLDVILFILFLILVFGKGYRK